MAVQDIVLGGFGNLGSVSLIVTSGFYSEQVVLEEIIRGGGGGGRYRHYTEYYHKPRKFGKKDEEELKRLLLKAAEEDRKAQKTLEKKAEDLQEVIGGIACIENAVAAAASEVRNMAASDEISWKKAKLILEELYEEEEILLAIVMNI